MNVKASIYIRQSYSHLLNAYLFDISVVVSLLFMLGHSRHEAGKVEDIIQQAFNQSVESITSILLHGGLEYHLRGL